MAHVLVLGGGFGGLVAALALARRLEEECRRGQTRITIITPEPPGERMEGEGVRGALREALDKHNVAFWLAA